MKDRHYQPEYAIKKKGARLRIAGITTLILTTLPLFSSTSPAAHTAGTATTADSSLLI